MTDSGHRRYQTAVEMSIPVVDFGRWYKGDSEDKKAVAKELGDACRRVGFVYIVNHGVEDVLLEQAFGWSKKLFDLPEEKKMLAPHPPGMCICSAS
jgi:isopenicillin N synthase-like dioxygenase